MQVTSIAECSPWSILQYFWPSLNYHLSLSPLFCLFLSGRLRQVLLYIIEMEQKVQNFPKNVETDNSEKGYDISSGSTLE